MKNQLKITLALLTLGVSAHAQIVPLHPPTEAEVIVGGSGSSDYALDRLGLNKTQIKTLSNLEGPSVGWGRKRHDIQMHPIVSSDLPDIEDYFLRSSYVTLDAGGLAPMHSHIERPAYLQVISGSVAQHRSDGRSFLMGPGDYTFSSDAISHWWNNIGDTPMTLWIVELCSAAHGCDKLIEGGATVLTGSAPAEKHDANATSNDIMQIDLAGEFPKAPSIGTEQLRLRKVEILSDQYSDFDAESNRGRPMYVRVAEGTLTVTNDDGGTPYTHGSILLLKEDDVAAEWSNQGDETVVLYAIDIFDEE